MKNCDLYFKRSFNKQLIEKFYFEYSKKIYPLGFNYHVVCKNLYFLGVKDVFRRLIGKTIRLDFTVDKFEIDKNNIRYTNNPKIIFLTRLWDRSQYELDDLDEINNNRIGIIRKLKEKYGNNFIGGLENNEVARELAPDLIVDEEITKRENYIKLLKEADIAIATKGLHGSIGWKTGEYVASAKAIVMEKPLFEFVGDFEKNKNYLEFSKIDEVINCVDKLVENPEMIYNMKQRNYDYYHEFLRPDKLVFNTLKIADEMINARKGN